MKRTTTPGPAESPAGDREGSSQVLVVPRLSRPLGLSLLASILFWIVAWHADAAISMARIWWHSETFAHGLIIYPVAGWLIWRKRDELTRLPLRPCMWALLPLAAAACIALLGSVANVEAARQFGLVAMIALAVVAVTGTAIGRAIAFPLAFTLLAVPMGEFMLPILMEHTADFTVAALRATGIPVFREGLFFTIPSGRWSVIETCSGLRYLIASVTLGCLFAYLSYVSLWRRALFVLASILVPVVANWLRAYMIVMIGHLSEMRYAVGVDHLIYGWLFFGVVMLILFWVGSWWREDREVSPTASSVRAPTAADAPGFQLIAATLSVAAVVASGPLYADFIEANEGESDFVLNAPSAVAGWETAPSRSPWFSPHYLNARASIQETYEKQGRQVGMFIAYYARQRQGAEMIAFGNGVVPATGGHWSRLSETRRHLEEQGLEVLESRLRSNGDALLTWHWYWVGGHWTARAEEAKLRQAIDRLAGRGNDAAVVVLYAVDGSAPNGEPRKLLQEFVAAMQPSILATLERIRAH